MRERQIPDAAVAVFSRRGFHLASMDDIAEVAGVSKPMIYAYLGSKDDLFIACIRREAQRLMELISAAVPVGLTRDERIIVLVAALLARSSDEDARAATMPVAHALVGAAEALSDWGLEHPEETPDALVARLMGVLWTGRQRTDPPSEVDP